MTATQTRTPDVVVVVPPEEKDLPGARFWRELAGVVPVLPPLAALFSRYSVEIEDRTDPSQPRRLWPPPEPAAGPANATWTGTGWTSGRVAPPEPPAPRPPHGYVHGNYVPPAPGVLVPGDPASGSPGSPPPGAAPSIPSPTRPVVPQPTISTPVDLRTIAAFAPQPGEGRPMTPDEVELVRRVQLGAPRLIQPGEVVALPPEVQVAPAAQVTPIPVVPATGVLSPEVMAQVEAARRAAAEPAADPVQAQIAAARAAAQGGKV